MFARNLDDVTSGRGSFGYRKLEGGKPGDYRYIISAATFPALERNIITGASKRLGVPVSRLSQLDDLTCAR